MGREAIEAKPRSGRGPDLDDPASELHERERRTRLGPELGSLAGRAHGRQERALGKCVQDVGQDQLLVLLLVREPEGDQGPDLFQPPLVEASQQLDHAAVHGTPIRRDLVGAGPRQDPTPRTRMTWTDRVIVRVEEVAIVLVDGGHPRWSEQELLEEPAGVGTMPLGRARIWHGLQLLVFRGQGQSKRFGAGSHPKKALGERVAIVAVIHP